jgi:Tfp pilus assembly protein PilO
MNAIAMNSSAHAGFGAFQFLMQPLDAWSRRRTVCSAFLCALLAFLAGMQTWRASTLARVEASRTALVAAQAKAVEAARLIDDLPDLRQRVAASALRPERWTSADALQSIAQLAAQSGLRVTEIEPIKSDAADRALKLRADGTFPEIQRFLDALCGLPRLIVPERVQIKGQAGVLGIETTLRVHEAMPAVALPEPARADAFLIDPFGKQNAGGFGRGADLLLVGTFVGHRRAMALVQSGEDVEGYAPGQQIGDERLRRITPREAELASDDGTSRTLAMAGERGAGSFERVASVAVDWKTVTGVDDAQRKKVKPQHRDEEDGKPARSKRKSEEKEASSPQHRSIFEKQSKAESRKKKTTEDRL